MQNKITFRKRYW